MSEDKALATVRQIKPKDGLDPSTALLTENNWKATVARWTNLITSGALPKHILKPEIAIAITRYGANYGWDEMRSINSIYIVNGKPCLSTESMVGLVREKLPEARIEIVETNSERAVVTSRRGPDHEPMTVTFTAEDAKTAGLLGKDIWKKYRADMLLWRALSRTCRRGFSDVILGAYTREEMQDAEWVERQGPRTSDHLPPELMPSHNLAVAEAVDAVEAELADSEGPAEPGTVGESLELDPPGDCDLCKGKDGYHESDCPHIQGGE